MAGSRERRLAACRQEVALNRRLAPDVYLDVVDIVGSDGAPCEHGVLMRRLPDDIRLATLVTAGADVRAQVRRVAELLAALHARSPRSARIDRAGLPESLRGLWEENLGVLAGYAGPVLDAPTLQRIRHRAHRYLIGRAALLAHRIRSGSIVNGHGDLLAEDIFCLPDRPRILDCLEFDDALRYGDVLADVGFLAMDLERLGAPGEAAAFLDDYRQASGTDHPVSLAHLYIAYRALVRVKIACLHHCGADAAAGRADLICLECWAPPEVTVARIGRRHAAGRDASDADTTVYRHLASRAGEWPSATRLDTSRPLPDTLANAAEAVSDVHLC
ncbi:MAG TPA: phosphotransferase [Mycobacteriales bacterium]|nr:phosphotransferase [Mycobacteriales bacterium]